MAKFNKGDRVRCIDPNGSIHMGVYTIRKGNYKLLAHGADYVNVEGKSHPFFATRFELIQEDKPVSKSKQEVMNWIKSNSDVTVVAIKYIEWTEGEGV